MRALLDVVPMGKPRMTKRDVKRDVWKKRPVVLRYRAFCDELRLRVARAKLVLPHGGAAVTFHLPMPDSWSKRKREAMLGRPHQTKPDIDNLLKALMDALFENDAVVYDIHPRKFWAVRGGIEVETP